MKVQLRYEAPSSNIALLLLTKGHKNNNNASLLSVAC